MRAGLTADAIDALGEEAVEVIATLIQAELGPQLGEAALNATRIWGLDDMDLVNAAAGAGLQAAHAAALILAGGTADEDHPAALKFRLFERGRWPVGVIGTSFHLF